MMIQAYVMASNVMPRDYCRDSLEHLRLLGRLDPLVPTRSYEPDKQTLSVLLHHSLACPLELSRLIVEYHDFIDLDYRFQLFVAWNTNPALSPSSCLSSSSSFEVWRYDSHAPLPSSSSGWSDLSASIRDRRILHALLPGHRTFQGRMLYHPHLFWPTSVDAAPLLDSSHDHIFGYRAKSTVPRYIWTHTCGAGSTQEHWDVPSDPPCASFVMESSNSDLSNAVQWPIECIRAMELCGHESAVIRQASGTILIVALADTTVVQRLDHIPFSLWPYHIVLPAVGVLLVLSSIGTRVHYILSQKERMCSALLSEHDRISCMAVFDHSFALQIKDDLVAVYRVDPTHLAVLPVARLCHPSFTHSFHDLLLVTNL